MDHKTLQFKITNIDYQGRTLEGYANAFGNVDLVGDIVHPGAFRKTLAERGNKVKLLWQHDINEPIGRPIELREDNSGLYIKAIISDTARGRDVLALLKDGAIGEMSIGYDPVKGGVDYTKDPGTGQSIRNLRELKLYEVSLVTFPANELAVVTGLKESGADCGCGQKADYPWDQCVSDQMERYGDEETARRVCGAIRARNKTYKDITDEERAEIEKELEIEPKTDKKEMTPRGPVQRLGDVLQGSIHRIFTMMCDDWYTMGYLDRDQRIQLSGLIGSALDVLTQGMPEEIASLELGGHPFMMMSASLNTEAKAGRVLAARNAERIINAMNLLKEALTDAGMMDMMPGDDEEDPAPDEGAADNKQAGSQAGPDEPPTNETLAALIDIQLSELKFLES